jgi:hypothetical protein
MRAAASARCYLRRTTGTSRSRCGRRGCAVYELRVARLAAEPGYVPGGAFRALADYTAYAAAAAAIERGILAGLRKADLGGAKRVAFYPAGAATALVLDVATPGWQRAISRSIRDGAAAAVRRVSGATGEVASRREIPPRPRSARVVSSAHGALLANSAHRLAETDLTAWRPDRRRTPERRRAACARMVHHPRPTVNARSSVDRPEPPASRARASAPSGSRRYRLEPPRGHRTRLSTGTPAAARRPSTPAARRRRPRRRGAARRRRRARGPRHPGWGARPRWRRAGRGAARFCPATSRATRRGVSSSGAQPSTST